MNIRYFHIAILLMATSCISVSTQQLKVVHQFAGKTEDFSTYPEKIFSGIAEIRETRGVWYASSFMNPEQHLAELNSIFKERINNDKIPGRVKTVFKILDDYARGLTALSSEAPSKTQEVLFGRLGADLDELLAGYNLMNEGHKLPSGAGAVLTKSMNIVTGTFLARRQMKALKVFVNQADTLVSALCDEMVKFLSSEGIGQLLDAEESGIQESFRFYFTKRINPVIGSDKEYIALMKTVGELKNLRNLTIRTAGNLKSAHKILTVEINRKKSLAETVMYLNNFYKDMDELKIAFGKNEQRTTNNKK